MAKYFKVLMKSTNPQIQDAPPTSNPSNIRQLQHNQTSYGLVISLP